MPTYLVAFVISDYQIDTVQGFSPKTNTEVRTRIDLASSLTRTIVQRTVFASRIELGAIFVYLLYYQQGLNIQVIEFQVQILLSIMAWPIMH